MTFTQLSPADRSAIAQEAARLALKSDNMLPNDAAEYLGVSPRSVARFAKNHPKAATVDEQGRRRIRRKWLDAFTEGRHVVAALERANV